MMDKPRCPHLQIHLAGDESYMWCKLEDRFCLLEGNNVCDIYEEYLAELVEDEADER